MLMEQLSLLVAFGAGLLSFLSPCVIPLVPVYIASLAGSEGLGTGVKRNRLAIFWHSLSFVVGFSIIFTLWGVGFNTQCLLSRSSPGSRRPADSLGAGDVSHL